MSHSRLNESVPPFSAKSLMRIHSIASKIFEQSRGMKTVALKGVKPFCHFEKIADLESVIDYFKKLISF